MNLKQLSDVQNLIDSKIEEGLSIEYKRELGSNKDIAKDVSAFANTEGGVVIYGIEERDGFPIAINWLENKGIKEKIQSVVLSAIHPEVEGVAIIPILNPDDDSQSIYAVRVLESDKSPHMADYRYYKRHGSQSIPMEDNEVKYAMFRKGLRRALELEINTNLELATKALDFIEKIYNYSPAQRKPIVFIPFRIDAWNAIVSSGLLSVLGEKVTKFVEVYDLIHEVNYLIDCQKFGEQIINVPTYESSIKHGTYLPAILRQKITKLLGLLSKLENI